jgi:low affinity Fe/Cu permease
MMNAFRRVADRTASIAGSPWMFVGTVVATVIWLVLGPLFDSRIPGS